MSPVVSRAQARFMRGVEKGTLKKKGLSKAKAAEFVEGVKTKGLPERKRKAKKSKSR